MIIKSILYIITIFFIGICFVAVFLYKFNKDMEDLAKEEIEPQMFWRVFGFVIVISLIIIIGLSILI